MKIVLAMLTFLVSFSAFSSASFYRGEISRIWAHDPEGGFIIVFQNPSSVSDCKNGYIQFNSNSMQPGLIKNSLSIALSAFHSNGTVGVVIDKQGAGEVCEALSIDVIK
ncbi:hypothetical protein B6A42_07895 [Vibrio coralliilyticus]|uniref:Uncharacterized protein n=1 Tax=Vibrio coralliilyticus TaxID=190893 RepID=A0AAN0SBF8_9VIBR|nr:hypothetical protein [Vibrio coralliilyticus]AIW18673.1 hypothetical protein IX92_06265 [Vibrio coralliilyticus]ARC92031.1 hypothetical protein B6A42_07895 [Vibrio coralliilyticus]NOH40688.1 hypothetical protein [Vibrio coralliilyticus]